MVSRGLAPSRAEASALVAAGRVLVSGAVADKAGRQVSPAEPVVVEGPPARFASRGGQKLEAAMDMFQVEVEGQTALDAGASTGGFTDCLLQRGATGVVAVDVGHGQLLPRIRHDPRVEVMERVNVRELGPGQLGGRQFPLVVADLSFISLVTVAPALTGLTRAGGDMVLLVKPQFEAGRQVVSRGGGVVREVEHWEAALRRVVGAYEALGAQARGVMVSPLKGAQGNVEFLVHFAIGQRAGADLEGEAIAGQVLDSQVLDGEVLDGEVLAGVARTGEPWRR